MTLTRRIGKILRALITALTAWIMIRLGEDGFILVSLLLSSALILFGVRNLIYYFSMARHMVNGRSILYIGVIAFDFGVFTLSIADHRGVFVALYLLGAHAFSGVIDILRAKEARQLEAPSWKLSLAEGIANIGFAAAAVVFGGFQGSMRDLTLIFAAGLFYSALLNLIAAFRKTAIVYIP
ncbi:MAG: hypothetical protein IJV40_13345 [Oscillospiraceae bacterium]|nr:hypothetical protein [Oscillospiraceae bacterium]